MIKGDTRSLDYGSYAVKGMGMRDSWFATGVDGCLRRVALPSRKLTWKPKKGPIKTTVLLKGGYMGFHVSLGECSGC